MQATTQRLFFGLPLDETARAALREKVVRLRALPWGPRVRWTRPEGWHCTLKFLGSVPVEATASLIAAAAKLAPLSGPSSEWRKLGAFPSLHRARILVAHLDDATEQLAYLAARLEDLASEHGVARETRAFRPHVTLARFERPCDAESFRSELVLTGRVSLGPVTLYASRLGPGGSQYEAVWRANA
jgi:2'-5' RNA ligase